MKPLVLFDIDSTLVKWSPAHGEAFQEAYRKVYGVEGKHERLYHGMTDQGIIYAVMERAGLGEAAIAAGLPQAMQVMAATYERLIKAEAVEVLPGVHELLPALHERDVILGLVTGNLEPIARLKLTKAGLRDYFSCGGYGSDDRERAKIVAIAISRAREQAGFTSGLEDVVVVGDSPLDIVAAKAAGVRGFGVATSSYSMAELKTAGAVGTFQDLSDTQALVGALGLK